MILHVQREHMKANMRAASDQYWALKKHRYEQMKLEKAEWAKKMMEQVMEVNTKICKSHGQIGWHFHLELYCSCK